MADEITDFLADFTEADAYISVDTGVLTPGKAPLVLVWKRPDTPALYRASVDAAAIKKKSPHWPDTLALQVALMCLCHHGPTLAMGPLEFYGGLARAKNNRAWLFLTDSLVREMPDICSFLFGGEDLKNVYSSSLNSAPDSTPGTPLSAEESQQETSSS